MSQEQQEEPTSEFPNLLEAAVCVPGVPFPHPHYSKQQTLVLPFNPLSLQCFPRVCVGKLTHPIGSEPEKSLSPDPHTPSFIPTMLGLQITLKILLKNPTSPPPPLPKGKLIK